MKRSLLIACCLVLLNLAPNSSVADDRVYSNLTFDPSVRNDYPMWTDVGDVFVVEMQVADQLPSYCNFGVPKLKRPMRAI